MTLPPPRLTSATEPTLRGPFGNAWLIDMDAVMRRRGQENDPRRAVSLPSWICSAAYAHPVWSHYWVFGIALREALGVPKAKVHFEGATHEVGCYALDPDHPPAIDEFPRFLTPANFHGQFTEPSDEAAAARIQQAVQDIIDGRLNPDTDFRQQWVQRFSGSNLLPGATPDYMATLPDGSLLVKGTGAGNARALEAASNLAATLKADESKPQ